MRSPKLGRESATLVIIDVQEGFRGAIDGFDGVVAATATLAEAAAVLGLPVLITEQYPKGLGPTVPEVAEHLPEGTVPLSKTVFSAVGSEGFNLAGKRQAILCGVESHVCVSQTALGLLDHGVEVHVVADAVGSRSAANCELGISKAERAGAWRTSVEMALFELLGEAGTPEFKAVQRLVLDYAP